MTLSSFESVIFIIKKGTAQKLFPTTKLYRLIVGSIHESTANLAKLDGSFVNDPYGLSI